MDISPLTSNPYVWSSLRSFRTRVDVKQEEFTFTIVIKLTSGKKSVS